MDNMKATHSSLRKLAEWIAGQTKGTMWRSVLYSQYRRLKALRERAGITTQQLNRRTCMESGNWNGFPRSEALKCLKVYIELEDQFESGDPGVA